MSYPVAVVYWLLVGWMLGTLSVLIGKAILQAVRRR